VNKRELVESIAGNAQITRLQAAKALEAFVETVSASLVNGDRVTLSGFGTFAVKERAARTGRNPQTGEPISIKAARVPGFKPGKALKDALN